MCYQRIGGNIMKKGYKVNKAAGIVDIVYASLVMFASLIMLVYLMIVGAAVSEVVGAAGGSQGEVDAFFATTGIVVFVITCALSVVYLVFGIKTLKYSNSSQKQYFSSKSALLAFAIVESVFLLFAFASIAASPEFASVPLLLIASLILRWIGYAYCVQGEKEEANKIVENNSQQADQQNTQNDAQQSEPVPNDDKMFQNLEKLNKLRVDGAITQEEFENMKKKIIE